jgi:NADH-quinone oxidoreductase subunit J
MITCHNPINAVLFLVGAFLCVAMIFLTLNAEFIAFALIIIYVGAIAVPFLFIVMMINIRRIERDNTTYLTIGVLLIITLAGQFSSIITHPSFWVILSDDADTDFTFNTPNAVDEAVRIDIVRRLGMILFMYRPVLILCIALILLVAMIGSIWLTNYKQGSFSSTQVGQLGRLRTVCSVYVYESHTLKNNRNYSI